MRCQHTSSRNRSEGIIVVVWDRADHLQAAAILGSSHSSSQPPRARTDKPAPPLPSQALRPNDRYDSRPHDGYGSSGNSPRYDSRPQDPRYGGGSAGHSPRYDSRPDPRADARYNNAVSPPPQNYGYGRGGPPPPQNHGRPPVNRPPPTPAPPRDANDRDALWPLFKAVDKDGKLLVSYRHTLFLERAV
jgi:hypothetical protein